MTTSTTSAIFYSSNHKYDWYMRINSDQQFYPNSKTFSNGRNIDKSKLN